MELQNIMDDIVCWSMTHIQMCDYFIHCYAAIFLHDGFNCCMASGVTTWCARQSRGESVTELMPLMKLLVHSYACCSGRHASPYWTFIRRWISMGFSPSVLKKRMTERRSSLVHVARGAAIFTLQLHRRIAFLHRTATCRPLFKPWVSLSSYKIIELCFEFFISLLRFSFDSPSNITKIVHVVSV
jgi:hypothetical protein